MEKLFETILTVIIVICSWYLVGWNVLYIIDERLIQWIDSAPTKTIGFLSIFCFPYWIYKYYKG